MDKFRSMISSIILHWKENQMMSLFTLFGMFYLTKKTKKVVNCLYKHYIRRIKDLKKEYGGEYAIVTGASQGLGKAYAKYLGKSGYNLILIARRQEELQEVGREITSKYGVNVQILVFDFNISPTEENYKRIIELIPKYDISILINNVGLQGGHPFQTQSLGSIQSFINVNMLSAAFMTKLLLPQLLYRYKKAGSRSLVLSVSSIISGGSWPYLCMYAATKAFLCAFSKSLSVEYKDKIDFECVLPGSVNTPSNTGSGIYYITDDIAARSHLRAVGYGDMGCAHPLHQLQYYVRNHKLNQIGRNHFAQRFILVGK